MEEFLSFFEAMPAWQKLGWIVVCMSANLIVESVRPLFRGGFRSWKHTRTNLTFLATTMVINVAFGAAAVGLFEWTAEKADDWRLPWAGWFSTRYEAKALREGRTPAYLIFRRR